jgi:predicted anti-sigma-YlaC factor YlaD
MTSLHVLLHGSHEETQELMSAFTEGQVRRLARWRITRHLRSCEGCRALYETFKRTLAGLRAIAGVDPPEHSGFADEVIAQIRRQDSG